MKWVEECGNRPFDINEIVLPDILINEDKSDNLSTILKSVFDQIWNAAGHSQSPNFNDKGEWKISE